MKDKFFTFKFIVMDFSEELSADGKKMWEALNNPDFFDESIERVAAKIEEKRVRKPAGPTYGFVIREINAMIANSETVVKDCEIKLRDYLIEEKYYKATQIQTVILCHNSLIKRLKNILSNKKAL